MRDRARIFRAGLRNSLAILTGFAGITAWRTRDAELCFGHRQHGGRHWLDIGRIVVSWTR